jgi:hypothetical protein
MLASWEERAYTRLVRTGSPSLADMPTRSLAPPTPTPNCETGFAGPPRAARCRALSARLPGLLSSPARPIMFCCDQC